MITLMGKWLGAEFLRVIHTSMSNEYKAKKSEEILEREDWMVRLSRTPAEFRDSSMYNAGSPRESGQERAWGYTEVRGI
jgi:hypothetical protein